MLIFVAHDFQNPPLRRFRRPFQELEKKYKVDFKFADEIYAAQHMLDQIEELIRKADFCLFEVSSWNRNVFLELGFARGCGKRNALLFKPTSGLFTALGFSEGHADVPSDIKGLKQVRYRSERALRLQLDDLLAELIESPNLVRAAEMFAARVAELLVRHPQGMLMREIAAQLGIDQPVAAGIVKNLVKEGQVEVTGYGNTTRYITKQPAQGTRIA